MAREFSSAGCFVDRRFVSIVLIFSAFLVFAVEARGGLPEQFIAKSWNREQGLPLAAVRDVVQDPDGFIWLATEDGFVRFDGKEFSVFDRLRMPELPTGLVDHLLPDPDGGLWIGTRQGLLFFDRGELRSVAEVSGLAVRALCRDGAALWIGTERGLFRIVEDRAERVLKDVDVRALALEPGGALRIGTSRGLLTLAPDHTVSETANFGDSEDVAVISLLYDSRDRLWIGTRRELYVLPPKSLAPELSGLQTLNIASLLEDRRGLIWVGSDAGLSYLDDGSWHRVDPLLLPDYNVLSLAEDHEGNLWTGTLLGGLTRIRRSPVMMLGEREGLLESNVWTVHEDQVGNIWIGSSGGLAILEPDGRLQLATVNPDLPETSISALGERRNGEMWVGTYGYGLFRRQGDAFYRVPDGEGLVARRLLEDSSGVMWVGSNQGLFTFQENADGEVVRAADPDLGTVWTREILEESPDTRWFGLAEGLARRREGRFERIPVFEGLEARSLLLRPDGALWIGTDHGLARIRDTNLPSQVDWIELEDGIPQDTLHVVLDDGDGRLWMSSNRGIFSASLDLLEAFLANRTEPIDWSAWDESHGLRSSEANGGTQTAGIVARDGRLLFPTIAGLAIFDPDRLERNAVPPPVALREVLLNGRPTPPLSPLVIGAEVTEIVIQYSGASFQDPEQVRYRYRLDESLAWNSETSRREAVFANLRPGRYRFEVVASNNEGVWNPQGARLELIVKPAWHQTNFFYLLCVLTASLLIFGAHRLGLRRVLRRQAELMQIRNELARRNAELEEIAYTTSHDLRNPLVTIHAFLGRLRKDLSKGKLDRAQEDLTRIQSAVGKLDQLLGDLFEPARLGRPITAAEKLSPDELAEEAIQPLTPEIERQDVEISIQPSMPAVRGERRRLVLVFHCLLENALRHMGSVDAPRVEVTARRTRDRVVLRVADNGRGIAPEYHEKIFEIFEQLHPREQVAAGSSSRIGSGVGLSLTRRIIEAHGGEIHVESAGDGTGAVFSFTLPAADVERRR